MSAQRGGRMTGQYVSGLAGKIFVLEFVPSGTSRGSIIIVPPFAEEMNRSRKMLSAQARRLMQIGYRVWLPDLFGTGDSQGDFCGWLRRWHSIAIARRFHSSECGLAVCCWLMRLAKLGSMRDAP